MENSSSPSMENLSSKHKGLSSNLGTLPEICCINQGLVRKWKIPKPLTIGGQREWSEGGSIKKSRGTQRLAA
jgi:hypothetical protein